MVAELEKLVSVCLFCGGQVIYVWEVRCPVSWSGGVG